MVKMITTQFNIAAGSVIGRIHKELGLNNQDSFIYGSTGDLLVGIVCDGCGSGKHTEIGSRLGSRLLLKKILHRLGLSSLNRGLFLSSLIDFSKQTRKEYLEKELSKFGEQLLIEIKDIVDAQILSNSIDEEYLKEFYQLINDQFLFTILGFIVTPKDTYIFSAGDGIYAINDKITVLESKDNFPLYYSYNLLNITPEKKDLFRIKVNESIPTEKLNSLLIGSDGLNDFINKEGNLDQFWKDDSYFKNFDKIRRKLFLMNKENVKIINGSIEKQQGLLSDDTSLIVIERKEN